VTNKMWQISYNSSIELGDICVLAGLNLSALCDTGLCVDLYICLITLALVIYSRNYVD
jgi:hypothetical protein